LVPMAEMDPVADTRQRSNSASDEDDARSNGSNDPYIEPGIPVEANGDHHPTSFHPLEYEWTFWYDKRPAQGKRLKGEQESYESNLRAIGTIGSVEEFWRYYNHLVKPSRLEINSNYHFFKSGVKPMWEDAANSKGGKWVLTFKDKTILDSCWENIVLGMVGETLDEDNEITGAVFSRRKAGDKIALWNKNNDNEAAIVGIGRKLKTLLGVDPSKVNSGYQNHEDSMKTGTSYSNPIRYKL